LKPAFLLPGNTPHHSSECGFSSLGATVSPVGEFAAYFHENAQILGHREPALPGKRAGKVAALETTGPSNRFLQPPPLAAEAVVGDCKQVMTSCDSDSQNSAAETSPDERTRRIRYHDEPGRRPDRSQAACAAV
jgi:hypothetical protein